MKVNFTKRINLEDFLSEISFFYEHCFKAFNLNDFNLQKFTEDLKREKNLNQNILNLAHLYKNLNDFSTSIEDMIKMLEGYKSLKDEMENKLTNSFQNDNLDFEQQNEEKQSRCKCSDKNGE